MAGSGGESGEGGTHQGQEHPCSVRRDPSYVKQGAGLDGETGETGARVAWQVGRDEKYRGPLMVVLAERREGSDHQLHEEGREQGQHPYQEASASASTWTWTCGGLPGPLRDSQHQE